MGTSRPPQPSIALSPGERVGRYELLYVLAQGGMGTVWLARRADSSDLPRFVALKTLLTGHAEIEQLRNMFLDESRIAARISHRNVAQLYDRGEERGALYLAMELVDGESLRTIHKDRQKAGAEFPLGCALRILADTCAGLHAAHESSDAEGRSLDLVHRDVSPQNILVAADGSVKVIDFGVAKTRDRLAKETTLGGFKGKLDYMPIEQAQSTDIDRRADVYAIGAILYELLMGHPPHDSAKLGQMNVLHKLALGEPYPRPRPEIPEPIVKLLDRALSWKRDGRFATCEALGQALEQAMFDCNVQATRADVARMLGEHSAHRKEQREKMRDDALRDVHERAASQGEYGVALTPTPSAVALRPARSRRKSLFGAIALGTGLVLVGAALGVTMRGPPPPPPPEAHSVAAAKPTVVVMTTSTPPPPPPPTAVVIDAGPPAPAKPAAKARGAASSKPRPAKAKDPDVDYGF
jgi:serine/threonine-protein kinase